jgi:hypothetical protein
MSEIRPIRIKILQSMGGPIYAVRCRACNYTCAYMASLDYAFERAENHIRRHREEIEKEMALEMEEQTC